VRLRHLAPALGVLLVLVIAGLCAPATSGLLTRFAFQDPGQPPLLVVRCGVLFFALSVLRDAPLRAAIVSLLFVFSLAVCGALYPFLLTCACLVALRSDADRTAQTVLYGSLAVAAALSLALYLKLPVLFPDPRDPRGMVAYWRLRRNPYQARSWALVWSQQEKNEPGNAYLTLAAIDWEIGRDAQARKVLAKVALGARSDTVRGLAESLRTRWDEERPTPR
jgi:hypothetical protein